jgi:hypothetical protein
MSDQEQPLAYIPKAFEKTGEFGKYSEFVRLAEQIQNLLVFITGIGIAMAGAGFFVVNSHLWRYTRQHAYALNTNRYVTAGVMLGVFMLLVFIALYLIIQFADRLDKNNDIRDWRKWRWFVPFWSVTLTVFGILAYLPSRQVHGTALVLITVIWVAFGGELGDAVRKPFSKQGLAAFIGFLAYASLAGFLFGRSLYWRIPHSLGGGQPPIVQVIFEDAAMLDALQLPRADGVFSDLSTLQLATPSTTISERLCLLSETRDGILVYDPIRRVTWSIRHEDVMSIRDVYRTGAQLSEDEQTFNCAPPAVTGDLLADLSSLLGNDVQAPSVATPSQMYEVR